MDVSVHYFLCNWDYLITLYCSTANTLSHASTNHRAERRVSWENIEWAGILSGSEFPCICFLSKCFTFLLLYLSISPVPCYLINLLAIVPHLPAYLMAGKWGEDVMGWVPITAGATGGSLVWVSALGSCTWVPLFFPMLWFQSSISLYFLLTYCPRLKNTKPDALSLVFDWSDDDQPPKPIIRRPDRGPSPAGCLFVPAGVRL